MTDVVADPMPPPPPVEDDAPLTLEIDLSALTIRDIRRIERELNRKLGNMFGNGLTGLDADTLAGVIWVMQSKVDPAFTMDDALDVKFSQVSEAASSDPDPTPPTPPTS